MRPSIYKYVKRIIVSDERGVALIFTLGILSLLLIIALAFSNSSITERKAAANAGNQTSARLLAQSAVERVIGALNFYTATASSFSDFVSYDNSSPNKKQYDWLWKLQTKTADGIVLYNFYPYNDEVTWQYVTKGPATNPEEILGRYAYVVIGTGGRLDPSACVKSGWTEDRSTFPITTSAPYTNTDQHEIRNGIDVNEINLQNLDTTATRITPTEVDALTAGATTRWTDYDTLFSILGISDSTKKSNFRTWFQVNQTPDPEAFWIDANNDSIKEDAEFFHRFNLNRSQADWNAISLSTIIAAPDAYSIATPSGGIKWLCNWQSTGGMPTANLCKYQIAANLKDYCDNDSDVTSGDASGTIIAPSAWGTTPPAFTGNELTPYINEIGILVTGVTAMDPIDTNSDGTPDYYNYKYTVNVKVAAELVNMYGYDFNMPAKIHIKGDLKFKCFSSATEETLSFDTSANPIDFSGGNLLGSAGYKYLFQTSTSASQDYTRNNIPNDSSAVIEEAKLENVKVILEYNGKNCDYSALPSLAAPTGIKILNNVIKDVVGYNYFSFQVDDPRQNLNTSDWTNNAVNIDSSGTGIATPDSRNSILTIAAAGNDPEVTTDPAYLDIMQNQHISTAYIRNAPMQSPWELGVIHRAEKWKTLNLKKYNDTNATSGGGAYADGDANILDQVKFTSDTKTYGKVNINSNIATLEPSLTPATDYNDVLCALFTGIALKQSDRTPLERVFGRVDSDTTQDPHPGTLKGTTGSFPNGLIVNTAQAYNLSKLLKKSNGSFKNRAEILSANKGSSDTAANASRVDALKLTDGTVKTATTDAEQEELIGKFVNLTKADSVDTITVIVLAQTIKDAGGVGSAFDLFYDWNKNGSIDTTDTDAMADSGNVDPLYQSGYRFTDFSGGTRDLPIYPTGLNDKVSALKGRYDRGVDKITGEIKMVATLYKNAITNKWKIVKVEYVEE